MYKTIFFCLDEKLPMRNWKQARSANTLPLLPTSNMPSESCRTTAHNEHQKNGKGKHCQCTYKTGYVITFITVIIVLAENCFLSMQIIVLQTFAPIQAIGFAKKILTCKALFRWFCKLLKGLKGSISPSWFQEPKHATYFFLNKTCSLSLNLKPRHGHGILLNKQYKIYLCLEILQCAWVEASMLLDLGPPQTECPDLTPSAEM